jgi:exodeoxyribonuclease VII small subunit
MEQSTQPQYTPVKELSYTQAMAELEALLRKMQSDDCDIDLLASMTRRATQLIAECRSRLTATDEELRSILAQLQQ